MSSTLTWWPAQQYVPNPLSIELKNALRKLSGEEVIDMTFTKNSLPVLKALLAAGIDDAKKLIDAVEFHGAINVQEVF